MDFRNRDHSFEMNAGMNYPPEPKTGIVVGEWIYDENCRAYRGTLPVVIQFEKTTPEHVTEPMVISRCPPCEWSRLISGFSNRKVKRWMILPS